MRLPNGYGGIVKLSGKRRKPYLIRKTAGWRVDRAGGRIVQDYMVVGYAATRSEALQILAEYNNNPFDIQNAKITFAELYEKWSDIKFKTTSHSTVNGYTIAYKACEPLYNKVFKDLKLADLQGVVDTCDKNYPTLKKVKVLMNQLYRYAMKNEVCSKNYADFVDILRYKNKNPKGFARDKFSDAEIELLWEHSADRFCQTVLMLIYSGVRVSELLDLRKENVFLEERYFDVLESKTESGIRKVPIAKKVLPFYEQWFNSSDSDYLIFNKAGGRFTYRNFYGQRFLPIMEQFGMDRTPHCCRHTCISMLARAGADQTVIKKIVGHSGAMTLTEKVYTHFDVKELIAAIDLI